MSGITAKIVADFKIPVPPLSLQVQFARRVKTHVAVEAIRAEVRDNMDSLVASELGRLLEMSSSEALTA